MIILFRQAKKRKLEKEAEVLQKDADQLAEEAEAQGKLELLTKSNALRRSAASKKELCLGISSEIKAKQSTL